MDSYRFTDYTDIKSNTMHWNILIAIILPVFPCCRQGTQTNQEMVAVHGSRVSAAGPSGNVGAEDNPYPSIEAIPLPAGYSRVSANRDTFAGWLRNIGLKKCRTVYLFNGVPKGNQRAQFAVLDISTGKTDLQQCADAVMRLRAEFLYAKNNFRNIDFYTEQRTRLNFMEWANGMRFRLKNGLLVGYTKGGADRYCAGRTCFDDYLQVVFSYCGTRSLEKQLIPVPRYRDMHIGDVLIRGGSPGHAMLVVDMAQDEQGHKIYLLAQSYMPAQDIHIVKNPYNNHLSPWYSIDEAGGENGGREGQEGKPGGREGTWGAIYTPEWTFYANQLRTWPKLALELQN
jgi:Domain of unknown function (4846)